ncbi:hypothetical protein BDN70DRAFT_823544 [Pholiota conissans]|uniref:Uncharacterized protein n=1 Tax=Pholiota conissans TaxID=109636 RepID=A0A9P5ZCK6_9AGAR|nr:hypothetical protein BDN70DRAFT_823544 [Pholiota conissans]
MRISFALDVLQNRDVALQQDFSLQELHCYNLPYGALGFISHVLTYYTIVCLYYGRSPLWPIKKVHYTKFDVVLAVVGIGLCVVMSVFTIVNCKDTWQLLVIAIWKLSMSLLNGLTALHVAIMIFNDPEREVVKTQNAAWWIVFYIPGMLAGMIGLMNLVVKVADQLPDLLYLTISFYCIIGAGVIIGTISVIIVCFLGGGVPHKIFATGTLGTISAFVVLSALYSDWALGIMLGNILGTPSGDSSGFYWTYFVAKRLTMFSL